MKLRNWLIYTLAKTALFVAAAFAGLVILVELTGLISGRTLGLGFGPGISVSFPADPRAAYPLYDRLMSFLPELFIAVTAAYACWQIGKILKTVKTGNEFQLLNAKRLLNTGLFIVICDLFMILFSVLNSNLVRRKIGQTTNNDLFTDSTGFSFSWLIVGFIMIILANVFRKGSELKQDHNLTF
jgi:hypothetical protein